MTYQLNLDYLSLPAKRAFNWQAWLILVGLYLTGNLAGIPLLIATGMPIETVEEWLLAAAIAAVLIGIGLFFASRTGLGAPLLEGILGKDAATDWLQTVAAISILTAITGSLIALAMPGSFNPNPEWYPDSWQLVMASIKAGIVEEIFSRLILVSLFAWLGSRVSRSDDGHPSRKVYWAAIILAGLMFGWAHVDDKLSIPGITTGFLAVILILNTSIGILFGWFYWRLGLECAMLVHFLVDAVFSTLVVPAYLTKDLWVWIGTGSVLIIAALVSFRILIRPKCGVKLNTT
jgi:membrane protease YdiL (CAAX protease family)